MNFKLGRYIHRVHPNKSPFKIWENGERGESRTPQFFEVPPIILGMVKATNFKFCTHILSIDWNNLSLLQISRKVARCVVRTLKTFQGTHILGASSGLLCNSSAVLFSLYTRHLFPLLLLTFAVHVSNTYVPRPAVTRPTTDWRCLSHVL